MNVISDRIVYKDLSIRSCLALQSIKIGGKKMFTATLFSLVSTYIHNIGI